LFNNFNKLLLQWIQGEIKGTASLVSALCGINIAFIIHKWIRTESMINSSWRIQMNSEVLTISPAKKSAGSGGSTEKKLKSLSAAASATGIMEGPIFRNRDKISQFTF
jgi:hypothetical protein